ncbi:uncharacterized protein LOC136078422 [Hydra vulgaris]|uniref:Uncharacterized protein LOC136078422 n=1 Tax=Hydra vulgaris TaxID=6087 RepID=A0ABM4BMG5_HYDVU
MADETVLTNINFNSFVSKKSILLNNYSDPDINFYNNDEIIKNINPLHYDPNSKKIANGMEDNYFSMLHINIRIKPNLSSTTNDYESLCIEIINKTSKNIVIHGLYRPPSGSIKEVIGKKSLYRNLLPLNLKFNNKQIVNKSLVAETLNQFFVNIGPTLSSNIATTQSHFSSYLTSTNLNVMSNYKLTEKELLDAVSLLKPNKSLGFDDISSNVIIKSIKQITIPLLHIFNLSLKQGVFPDNLKIAKVIPVLKSGDPSDVTNYRPISILSCFSKILERVMYNRLYSFLNVNNILFHKQFGFKSGHSTDHAITHLVHDIFKGFDEDKYTLGVFIDLSKAFDTVNYQILLSKLKSYGNEFYTFHSKQQPTISPPILMSALQNI